jgi:hypothetical protein
MPQPLVPVVRRKVPLAVAALITAVTLISGVGTAAAAEETKPTSR